jgi:hypothetical protein
MRKLIARWLFIFATFNIYLASLVEEAETAAMLVWLYKDLMAGAREALKGD